MNDTLTPSDISALQARFPAPHAYLRFLSTEAARIAQSLYESGDWDDSASDASEAADALVVAVDCMYAASDSDRRERAAESAREWKQVERREFAA